MGDEETIPFAVCSGLRCNKYSFFNGRLYVAFGAGAVAEVVTLKMQSARPTAGGGWGVMREDGRVSGTGGQV